ncbi:MAG: hypothetical protein IKE65_01725 [Clostridia bacterium]|nr:hypothetical protein [Clostridia bacterium]
MKKKKRAIIIISIVAAAAIAAGGILLLVHRNNTKTAQNVTGGDGMEQTTQYVSTGESKGKIKVACIGDSITYGFGLSHPEKQAYPAQLQEMLGDEYEVVNFGLSGRTVSLQADMPYALEDYYEQSQSFTPDIVLFMLGTNDTKPSNWDKEHFVSDFRFLVGSYVTLPGSPRVYVITPTPLFDMPAQADAPNEKTLKTQAVPLLKKEAAAMQLPVIDLYTAFAGKSDLFYDGCHPNEVGSKAIAQAIYQTIVKGKENG